MIGQCNAVVEPSSANPVSDSVDRQPHGELNSRIGELTQITELRRLVENTLTPSCGNSIEQALERAVHGRRAKQPVRRSRQDTEDAIVRIATLGPGLAPPNIDCVVSVIVAIRDTPSVAGAAALGCQFDSARIGDRRNSSACSRVLRSWSTPKNLFLGTGFDPPPVPCPRWMEVQWICERFPKSNVGRRLWCNASLAWRGSNDYS